MKFMVISMVTILTLIMMIGLVTLSISKKMIIDTQKASPFECGFNPMIYTRIPFSIHFFLIAVIFLIFDIEIIIIMPIIITLKTSMMKYWLISLMTFITILIIGLSHEWKNGMISWSM